MAIPTVLVTGTFTAPDGRPASGYVEFKLPNTLIFPGEDRIAAGLTACALNEYGQFTVALIATDAPGMQPTGWAYQVREQINGLPAREYAILLPQAQPAVDLADIARADPSAGNYVPVVGPQGPPGVVQSVNGKSAAAVTLTAADVGAVATTAVGAAGGVAALDGGGKVPSAQLPAAPVQSVNGQTGVVALTSGDVGALPAAGGTATGPVKVSGAAGTFRALGLATGGVDRWLIQADDTAEPGDGTGSNLRITCRNDAGALVTTVLYGDRATGNVAFGTITPTAGARVTVNGATALRNVTSDPAAVASNAFVYSKSGSVYVRESGGTVIQIVDAVPTSAKGAANGVATLGSNGRVPDAQLPNANQFGPEDSGFIAWTFDPAASGDTPQYLLAGYVYTMGLVLHRPATLTNACLFLVSQASYTLTSGQCYLGLYNESGTRVAVTASIHGSFPAGGGLVEVPFTAPYSAAAGRYWLGLVLNGNTTSAQGGPALARGASAGTPTAGAAATSGGFKRHFRLTTTGATALPASFNPSTGVTLDANAIWGAVT